MMVKRLLYAFFVAGLFFLYLYSNGMVIFNSKKLIFEDKHKLEELNKGLQIESLFLGPNAIEQIQPTIDIINFNSDLTYFPGGSVSVLFEPKGIFSVDNVFRLEMSDANGSFGSPTVLATKKKYSKIKSLDLKSNFENQFVINFSDFNKSSVYFFGSPVFYFLKLMLYVG